MYAIYKDVHPPTVVEHCCECNFFSDAEKNLVVAGASEVRVFRLISEVEDDGKHDSDHKKKRKLEQMAEYSLFGNVASMKAIRIGNSPRHSLIMSFRDAKLSVVEYDPSTHDLKTVSLHYFENDEFMGGYIENVNDPIVRVDPENRCAVMLVYGRHLVVLPFKQEATVDDEQSQQSEQSSSQLSSYTVDLQSIEEQLLNVTDFQFLHGYYESTLLFLYEPVKTFAGRVAVRQDTHCIATISLNIAERVNPIIWSVSGLPFDCHTVVPVMKPLGGVLIFANNALLYLNQSVPPYGVSLNSITDNSTMFPLKIQEDVVLSLEGAMASFISNDVLVMSLKGGELYVLTLITDGLRSVRSFNFDKAAGSVLASCICTVHDGHIFLGSRLGNSLLLKYTEKSPELSDPVINKDGPSPPPPMKKRKVDPSNPFIYDDLDDLEVYGATVDKTLGLQLTSYSFEVCDSLLNIGPCVESAVGQPAFLSEEFSSSPNPDLEVVFCSGYGKNGALSVLQRSIRPQVVTTFELPGCTDMWTVFSESKTSEDNDGYHSFLILSREDSSMVLETEAEILEIDNSGFSTQYPTVHTGNIGNNKYIIQVCPMSVRLLQGVKQLQEIPMDSGSSAIVFCSVADPHLILMTVDGSLIYGKLIQDFTGTRLKLQKAAIDKTSRITSCCMYRDTSGLFTTDLVETVAAKPKPDFIAKTPIHKKAPEPQSMADIDEDEFLYGDSSIEPEPQTTVAEVEQRRPTSESHTGNIKPTYWVIVCRERGSFEIYTIPDFKLVFFCSNLSNAPKLLIDSGVVNMQSGSSTKDAPIDEVLVVGLGHMDRRPHIFAMVEQDLVVYEAFPFHTKAADSHLLLRFKKINMNLLIREKTETRLANFPGKVGSNGRRTRVPSLRPFKDISSYTGVFVCGPYPHWLFITSRGNLNAHPMNIDGAVTCFAPFHNINCPKGFLYFNKPGELRIAVLPTHLSYDAPWPIRKVPLKATPYSVAYNKDNKVYAVATTTLEPNKKIPKFNTEDKEWETLERDSRYIHPMLERFHIQLVSPARWEIVPHIKYEFEEFEHVASMKTLELKSQETHSGYKTFLAVGTVYNFGEDLTSKGRVHIFDIIEVVPEPGQPLTKHKFKCLYAKEQKGPVTSICAVQGYLLTALGQKIYVWNFKDNADLVGMAFIDTQVYVHQMLPMKNLVLTSDIAKGIHLLKFQEQFNNLSLVSRDIKPLDMYSSEYFVDGTTLGFLVCDGDKNLLLFAYQPEALESFGGQRLLQKGDINTGSHANTMFRIKVAMDPLAEMHQMPDGRHVTYLANLDGGIGLALPMPEKTYRRLLMLQNKLIDCLQHVAGLNPKAFRAMHLTRRHLTNPHRNILDGKLISKYLGLSVTERLELARKIGTTSTQIMDDLIEIERVTSHF